MIRAIIAIGAVSAALFCSAAGPAIAAEFCPATAYGWHTFETAKPYTIAVRLGAGSKRSVQGDIEIYSDGDLYTAPFAPVPLDKDTDHDVYITLPKAPNADTIVWVADGRTTGETEYGWTDELAPCDPPGGIGATPRPAMPSPRPTTPPSPSGSPSPAPTPTPEPWVEPNASTPISVAKQLPPPNLSCDHPAAQASVIKAVAPPWPFAYYQLHARDYAAVPFPLTVKVIISLDDTGHVADVTVQHPVAEYKGFYDAAMAAAVHSTYAPARSMCTNIPGLYVFVADFSMGGL